MKGTIQIRDVVFFYFINFLGGFSLEKIILRITIYSNIFIFMTVTNNIDQKQIKYHVFDAVTNSELTELVPVFTMRPAFPTSVKKVNTSFKNVWLTWGPALPTLLADLMIFCPLGPIGSTNFKNSDIFILDKNNERPDWMTDLKHTDSAWWKDACKRNLCYIYSFVWFWNVVDHWFKQEKREKGGVVNFTVK